MRVAPAHPAYGEPCGRPHATVPAIASLCRTRRAVAMTVEISLAAVLDVWMAAAEPGERSPYVRIALSDPDGAVLTSHELTYRQATELTALISDAPPDAAPGQLAAELARFAGPAGPFAVNLI